MAYKHILVKAGNAAAWAANNDVLADREIAFLLASSGAPTALYVGDGVTPFSGLTPMAGGGGGDHATLTHLAYATAGHTGFEVSGAGAAAVSSHNTTTGVHGVGAGTIAQVADIATNTNLSSSAQAAITASHARSHAITSTSDHTSAITPGKLIKAAATTGVPAEASNTDTEVAAAVTASHSNANDPTADQKAALAGTDGTPSASDKYVTNSDSRMTDARTPTAHNQSATTITAGTATGPIAVTGSYNSTLVVDTVAGGAVTVNWSLGNVHRLILGNNSNTVTLSNPTSGLRGLIILVQPSSGAAGTVTFSPSVKTAGGAGITLTATNSAVDDVYLMYDGTGTAYHAMAALAWA